MTVRKKVLGMRPALKGRDDAESLMSIPEVPVSRGLTQAQYVNLRGEVCPNCREDQKLDVLTPLDGPVDGIIWRDLQCPKCGATWKEQFVVAAFCHFRFAGSSADRKERRRQRRLLRKGRV